jgi:hypothetical protein
MAATEDGNEDEEEDVLLVLSEALEIAEPFRSDEFYMEPGHMLPAGEFKNIVEYLKKVGKLKGCSLGGIATKLVNNFYPKKQARFNFENTKFYVGLKAKAEEAGERTGKFSNACMFPIVSTCFRFSIIKWKLRLSWKPRHFKTKV